MTHQRHQVNPRLVRLITWAVVVCAAWFWIPFVIVAFVAVLVACVLMRAVCQALAWWFDRSG